MIMVIISTITKQAINKQDKTKRHPQHTYNTWIQLSRLQKIYRLSSLVLDYAIKE